MSIADEARAEESWAAFRGETPTNNQPLMRTAFLAGWGAHVEWLASRKPEAAPSDTDWMLECSECGTRLDALEELRGTGEFGVQVARYMAAAAGWTSDPANDDDWCSKCSAARTSQPVPSDTDRDVRAWIDKTLALPMYQNSTSEYGQGVVETLRAVRKLLDGGMHPDTREALRTSQPVQVEVTDDMVDRAARILYADLWNAGFKTKTRRLTRLALSAALGGGE